MTLTSKPLAILIVLIMFGGILFSNGMGWWSTVSSKVPAAYTEGEFAGQANPADIRGSYTLGDIEKNFDISAALLTQAFAVQTDDPAAYQVKNLETQYAESQVEIGTSSVRLFVAFYKGLPFDLSTDIYLPETAVNLLQERPLTPEQSAYLAAHIARQTNDEPGPIVTQPAPTVPAETQPAETTERTIKGKTTFAELLSWGVLQPDIEKVLGVSLPTDASMKIKDFCTANNLDFETIKPALQTLVDKAP